MAARNMYRIEINIQEKIVHQVCYLQECSSTVPTGHCFTSQYCGAPIDCTFPPSDVDLHPFSSDMHSLAVRYVVGLCAVNNGGGEVRKCKLFVESRILPYF